MPFELARQILQRRCYRPPAVDGHACTVEVTMFDLRPFADVAWIQEDGTKVFLAEAERPRPLDGHGAGKDWEKVPPTWQGQPPGSDVPPPFVGGDRSASHRNFTSSGKWPKTVSRAKVSAQD